MKVLFLRNIFAAIVLFVLMVVVLGVNAQGLNKNSNVVNNAAATYVIDNSIGIQEQLEQKLLNSLGPDATYAQQQIFLLQLMTDQKQSPETIKHIGELLIQKSKPMKPL